MVGGEEGRVAEEKPLHHHLHHLLSLNPNHNRSRSRNRNRKQPLNHNRRLNQRLNHNQCPNREGAKVEEEVVVAEAVSEAVESDNPFVCDASINNNMFG